MKSPTKERRTVRKNGRVSDRVHTRQTTAVHAAQDRSRRDPPGTTPSRGPERVRRGARPAPLPRQRPAAGTKSPVLGRPPRAPRSHTVKPGATALGVGEGTTVTGKRTGAPRATGPREERRTNAGPRGTAERHAAGNNHGTRTGATGCRGPGKRAQHGTNRGTGQGAKDSRAPTLARRTHGQWEAGPGHTPEGARSRGWESARPRTPHTQARAAPPGHPHAAPTERKASS